MEKVSLEIAESDFLRMCKAARLNWERQVSIDSDAANTDKSLVVAAIMDGLLEVDESGFPTIKTESDELPEIKFKRRPRGKDLLASEKFKKEQRMSAYYAVIAQYLGINPTYLKELETVDLTLVQTVYGIFLGT